MTNIKRRTVSKDDIDRAWDKRMADSHCNPMIIESSKRKNKYHQTKLRAQKLRNVLGF